MDFLLFRSKYFYLFSCKRRWRCLAVGVFQLIWEPVQPFVEAIAARSTGGLNVPASVSTKRRERLLNVARVWGSVRKKQNCSKGLQLSWIGWVIIDAKWMTRVCIVFVAKFTIKVSSTTSPSFFRWNLKCQSGIRKSFRLDTDRSCCCCPLLSWLRYICSESLISSHISQELYDVTTRHRLQLKTGHVSEVGDVVSSVPRCLCERCSKCSRRD